MVLNSSRLMPALCSRYCGMVLYLSNSACHAGASRGGITPVTGFHSTIERPDSVSRVAPPTTTVTNIRAATASSHSRTARRWVSEDRARLLMGSFVRRQCGCEGPTSSRRVCGGDLQIQETGKFASIPSHLKFARERPACERRHHDTSGADHIVARALVQLSERCPSDCANSSVRSCSSSWW